MSTFICHSTFSCYEGGGGDEEAEELAVELLPQYSLTASSHSWSQFASACDRGMGCKGDDQARCFQAVISPRRERETSYLYLFPSRSRLFYSHVVSRTESSFRQRAWELIPPGSRLPAQRSLGEL